YQTFHQNEMLHKNYNVKAHQIMKSSYQMNQDNFPEPFYHSTNILLQQIGLFLFLWFDEVASRRNNQIGCVLQHLSDNHRCLLILGTISPTYPAVPLSLDFPCLNHNP